MSHVWCLIFVSEFLPAVVVGFNSSCILCTAVGRFRFYSKLKTCLNCISDWIRIVLEMFKRILKYSVARLNKAEICMHRRLNKVNPLAFIASICRNYLSVEENTLCPGLFSFIEYCIFFLRIHLTQTMLFLEILPFHYFLFSRQIQVCLRKITLT